jgi:rfaE bifunctional protein kinase chain/domain
VNAREILDRIPSVRALVVGDICLDRWCQYDPFLAEPSRETGLDRVAVVATETTAGAGGTVANNLAALGCGRVAVLGVVGRDGHAWELREALDRWKIDSSLLVEGPGATFTYTKLINRRSGAEDLGRIDFLASPPPGEVDAEVVRRLREAVSGFDVILVSDQTETVTGGVVTAAVREALAELSAEFPSRIFLVDSRMRIERFRGVIVKPNEREAGEACERLGLAAGDFRGLRSAVGHRLMMVTHGPRGVLLLDGEDEAWVKTKPVENPVDICGAGDSFSAGCALALAAGAPPADAARFANLVTGVTIMKSGTGTASPAEGMEAERALAQ